MGRSKKTGYSICLGEETHKAARYQRIKNRVVLGEASFLTSEELRLSAKKAKSVTACFCPSTIYADLGNFSSITNDATLAHIRSTIDKTGLFNDEYSISFKKLHDIDDVRARFSYLAIPTSDVNKVAILNEKETLLYIYCPIEAAVASVIAQQTREMTITVLEEHNYVRLIGSKQGAIYYLITINKNESFDLLAETISGINEMVSLLKNSYNASAHCIYAVDLKEISLADLEENDIHAEPFSIQSIDKITDSDVDLLGNVSVSGYDFTPKRFRENRQMATYSRYSMGISAVLILASFLLFGLGLKNSHTAQTYQNKAQVAQEIYEKNLNALERDYTELKNNLDFSNINGVISMYKDFEEEPKLYTILSIITRKVPKNMSLTTIEVTRPGLDQNSSARIVSEQTGRRYSTHTDSLNIKINGLIESPYPRSKKTFSSFISDIQDEYTVNNAMFQHNEKTASFSLECETRK
jgi:hypothetical protein